MCNYFLSQQFPKEEIKKKKEEKGEPGQNHITSTQNRICEQNNL